MTITTFNFSADGKLSSRVESCQDAGRFRGTFQSVRANNSSVLNWPGTEHLLHVSTLLVSAPRNTTARCSATSPAHGITTAFPVIHNVRITHHLLAHTVTCEQRRTRKTQNEELVDDKRLCTFGEGISIYLKTG